MGLLTDGAVYFGDHGRAMCSDVTCAGATALFTGEDLSGQRVTRVTEGHVREWRLACPDLPLGCDCGRIVLYTPPARPVTP